MMKKIMFLCSVLLATLADAQTLNIHFKNGTTVEFDKEIVDHVDFSEKPAPPSLTTGESVDLGLSVKWASCNLGASKPEEAGDYYAWGETHTKTDYSQEYYAYFNMNTSTYVDIGNDISGTAYDAACVNLGRGWRMPTKAEFDELCDKCKWEWKQINGVNGYVISRNGKSIFMPASGYMITDFYRVNEELYYWTSTRSSSGRLGRNLYASSSVYEMTNFNSSTPFYHGLTIRPVISYDDADGTTDYDDTPVTSKVSSYYAGGSVMSNGSTILGGSKLNFYFKNGSSEIVTLTGVQLINGVTNVVGNNLLSSDVRVVGGSSSGYTITVGAGGTQEPICRFTYRYNNHTYTTEAKYQSFNFAKGKTTQLIAE